MNNAVKYLLLLLAIGNSHPTKAQHCNALDLQWRADIPSTCNEMVMTTLHDQNGLPYLYMANKEGGLKIYDIRSLSAPSLIAAVPTAAFGMLEVMNLHQVGNYLYLALGNHFTNPQAGGLAVVDVADPASPTVTDYFIVPNSNSGAGIVKVEGNYAYLGAMKSGLVILDIADKNDIRFISQFVPDINFPPVNNPNPNFYNARGMAVKNSIVYLCHDAGGIRVINCENKLQPRETGRWCNPAMYLPFNRPRAYNNCILDGPLLYVTVDYAGLEVLDISDTSNISMPAWWNPLNAPANNWFTSEMHTNEIAFDSHCTTLFLSTGKSDLMAVDISDPTRPEFCATYGGVDNGIGTWGISTYQNQLYLSYICVPPPGIPFSSSWTGVKILTYNSCTTGIEEHPTPNISLFPNPFTSHTLLQSDRPLSNAVLSIYNLYGQKVRELDNLYGGEIKLERGNLSSGLYFLTLVENKRVSLVGKILIK